MPRTTNYISEPIILNKLVSNNNISRNTIAKNHSKIAISADTSVRVWKTQDDNAEPFQSGRMTFATVKKITSQYIDLFQYLILI